MTDAAKIARGRVSAHEAFEAAMAKFPKTMGHLANSDKPSAPNSKGTQMSEPTDDQVWTAFDTGQAEAKSWRILDFYKGRGVIAVRDLMPLPHDAASADLDLTALAAERHDFKDVIDARRYIEWRSIKAALSTYAQEIADE